ncbi:terminase small subunit [Levilactobacillus brevis]|uniref:terminase small subunit n=1 Tax=Levilactobacillus brevis TaxID=1580 RepID=UPI002072EAE4|nr:terminase small subunit [Levilactobacillus brevis]MCM6799445.1 terminase small subunit [Levilactobacillus brevis]MCM6801856.1 terminase small subunit [Levilactobacillus brevis]MCM6806550.1 terminase small subunit [Levilactobacillus brevis]MCM6807487.1 terminase small subunit [Levilactobacillus brevis]MCM6813371.1 terminase small subunit [Levilactobacillus brevis]
MTRKLTAKQRKFANEFIKTNNAYQSAISAGYSKNYASVGTKKLLENVRIQNYIQQKTGDVEKHESDEADEVLRNIYRISAGKEIERHYVQIDNLAKEAAGDDDSLDARMGYMVDNTTLTPASTKEQVAAAELWFKLNGKLKNDSKEVEEQKIRKLEAEADVAEQKARDARSGGQDVGKQFDKMFERLKEDSDK